MAATDLFPGFANIPDGPASRGVAVTPSDTVDLPFVSRYLWIGGTGNVALITSGGDTVTITAIVGRFSVRASRVLLTGTTATNITAWA